jgi:hypothetical protein
MLVKSGRPPPLLGITTTESTPLDIMLYRDWWEGGTTLKELYNFFNYF